MKISPSGETYTAIYCLKTDLWHDYQYFLEDAKKHEVSGETRTLNRSFRVAVLALFAHLEASVDDIIANHTSFSDNEYSKKLHIKCQLIGDQLGVPSVSTKEYKDIRNIVMHPSGKDHSVPFEQNSPGNLEEFGENISAWLDQISEKTSIPRFNDTQDKRIIECMAPNSKDQIEEI